MSKQTLESEGLTKGQTNKQTNKRTNSELLPSSVPQSKELSLWIVLPAFSHNLPLSRQTQQQTNSSTKEQKAKSSCPELFLWTFFFSERLRKIVLLIKIPEFDYWAIWQNSLSSCPFLCSSLFSKNIRITALNKREKPIPRHTLTAARDLTRWVGAKCTSFKMLRYSLFIFTTALRNLQELGKLHEWNKRRQVLQNLHILLTRYNSWHVFLETSSNQT